MWIIISLKLQGANLKGIGGYGTVHHVAFATENNQTELEAQEKIINSFGILYD